jgi:hypothetical protein
MQPEERTPIERPDPDSLAPVPIARLSVEDEAAMMNRGKGRQIAAVVTGLALCAAVAVYWVRGMDARQRYETALASAAQVQEQHANAFLHCALQGVHRSQIESPESLQFTIARLSARLGRSYGRRLEHCAPKLAGLSPALKALAVPADVQGELGAARAAADALQRAWDGYRKHLADVSVYDEAGAAPHIAQVAQSFGRYEQSRAALEAALRAPPD